MDYSARLDRAYDALPEIGTDEQRLDVPDATAQSDGAFTRFQNLSKVADALDRDSKHLHRYVQSQLGTAGSFENGVGRYNGRFSGTEFDAVVDDYMAAYVTCTECGLPDTRLVTEDRTQMLRCDACGAFRPVEKQATASSSGSAGGHDEIEEGNTYELKITGTGRKGDGVAERGSYTVFVTGAEEGDVVEAYIESVSGNLAFARLA
jgi:translation initiation factor 2 subunit 2